MNKCKCILQSGPNKGRSCDSKLKEKAKTCGKHVKTCVTASSPKKVAMKRRMSFNPQSSPPLGEEEINLNLTKKLNLDIKELSKIEKIAWKKHSLVYNGIKHILDPIKKRVMKDYADLGDCFLDIIMYIDVKTEEVYFKKEFKEDNLNITKVIKAIENCLDRKDVNIVAMRLEVNKNKRENHAHAIIFNKKRTAKVVEIYDPNGYISHLQDYGHIKNGQQVSRVVELAQSFFDKLGRDYRVLNINVNNPRIGLQYVETLAQKRKGENYAYLKDYIEDGLCQAWSLYIIELRALNSDLPANKFAQFLYNRMKKVVPEEPKTVGGDAVANYIITYLYSGWAQTQGK